MRPNSRPSLIQLLAVFAIVLLLAPLAVTPIIASQQKNQVSACKQNLRDVAHTLKSYVDTHRKGAWPGKSGTAFLLTPYLEDVVIGEETNIFLCPGTGDDNANGEEYSEKNDIDPTTISYAGRNNLNYPMDSNRLSEMVLAADDNDGRGNHKHITNVAYADGSVMQYDVRDYENALELLGIDYLIVGPDSPIEELRVLSLD